MQKTVVILVGPKGAGKTYIGSLIEAALQVHFLRVERVLLDHVKRHDVPPDGLPRGGFDVEEAAIDDVLRTANSVVFEATGSSVYFADVIEALRAKYSVQLVRIRCPLDLCRRRAEQRDATEQLPVTWAQFESINAKANAVELDWDLEVDNGPDVSTSTLMNALRPLLQV
ncbi:MAG: AAA family ATPase [Deltaproteobacteria bacterium]|nr:AAA family ATPase [Deltaproteobacteria bacterium]